MIVCLFILVLLLLKFLYSYTCKLKPDLLSMVFCFLLHISHSVVAALDIKSLNSVTEFQIQVHNFMFKVTYFLAQISVFPFKLNKINDFSVICVNNESFKTVHLCLNY